MHLEQHSNIPKDHDSQMLQAEVEAWLAKGNKIKVLSDSRQRHKQGNYYDHPHNVYLRERLGTLSKRQLKEFAKKTQKFTADWLEMAMYGHTQITQPQMKILRYTLNQWSE